MSIGLGIFLSALIFASIYLMKTSKLTWKIVLKFSKVVVIVVIGIIVVIYLYVKISNIPTKQTSYAGLRLGMTMQEVKYIKGYPPIVDAEPAADGEWKGFASVLQTKDFKNNENVEDFYTWSYEEPFNARLDVEFDKHDKKVSSVSCYSTGYSNCPYLLGIPDGMAEETVIEKLGKPDKEKMEGVTKKIAYSRLNVFFYLTKQQVYTLGVVAFK